MENRREKKALILFSLFSPAILSSYLSHFPIFFSSMRQILNLRGMNLNRAPVAKLIHSKSLFSHTKYVNNYTSAA